jgi:hypothetical protein
MSAGDAALGGIDHEAGAIAVAATALTPLPLRGLLSSGAWATSPEVRQVCLAVTRIPDGAQVAADNRLAPQLTSRCTIATSDPRSPATIGPVPSARTPAMMTGGPDPHLGRDGHPVKSHGGCSGWRAGRAHLDADEECGQRQSLDAAQRRGLRPGHETSSASVVRRAVRGTSRDRAW